MSADAVGGLGAEMVCPRCKGAGHVLFSDGTMGPHGEGEWCSTCAGKGKFKDRRTAPTPSLVEAAEVQPEATICGPIPDDKTLTALGEMVKALATSLKIEASILAVGETLSKGRPNYTGNISVYSDAVIESMQASYDHMAKVIGDVVKRALHPSGGDGKGGQDGSL